MKIKSKLLALTLCLTVLISMTGFNTKENAKIDTTLIKDDFYTAVNKDWLSKAKIKDGQMSVSSITEISDIVDGSIKKIFNNLSNKKDSLNENSTDKKIIDLYDAILDTDSRNKDGIKPIEKYLEQIKSVKTIDELNKLLTDPTLSLYNSFVTFSVATDMKDSTKNILSVSSTVLTLGNSDSYSEPNDVDKSLKKASTAYYKKVLKLSGYSDEEATKKIDNLFKLEEMIAPSIMGQKYVTTNTNILEEIYNVYTIDGLDKLAPNLKLPNLLKSLGFAKANKIVLQEPKALEKLNQLYTTENLQLFKDILEINVIKDAAGSLSDEFVKAAQDFNNEVYGVKGSISKEETAMNISSSVFKSYIGDLYIKENFTGKDKLEIEILIKQIIASYKEMLTTTNVIGNETRKNAIKKLDNLKVEIGYPDKLDDYSNIKIVSYKNGGSVYQNLLNVGLNSRAESIESLNKLPKDLWSILPAHTINAFYNSTQNAIYFPAGILQYPFYDKNNSREENLGGIGIVIAHEISHAFDTNGSQFDEKGKLNNWWTKEDYASFQERTNKVRDFYSKIEYLPGKNVNGDLTVGENVADIAAVQSILNVLGDMSKPNYKEFFESWPKVFRSIYTNEVQDLLLNLDTHSPDKIRTNAVFGQFDKFYETYGIKKGDKMYVAPENRLKIW